MAAPKTFRDRGFKMQVLVHHAGKWLVTVFQNTNSVPERPFAKRVPAVQQ